MRKRLGLFLALAASFVLVSGVVGSAAWFTSQATDPVTATAGRLHLTLTGSGTPSITLANMAPGDWSAPYEVDVYNNNTPASTMALKFRITAAQTGGDGAMFNKLNVRVHSGNCNSGTLPSNAPVVWGDGPLNALDVRSNSTPGIIFNPLPVNYTDCFAYQFQLDPSVDNSYQGNSTTFNIVVDGAQVADPSF